VLTLAVGARIESNGANGGSGGNTNGLSNRPAGCGGGGSGGSGGPVVVLYGTGTNVDTTRVVSVAGTGGAAGVTAPNANGTRDGGSGRAGEDGLVMIRQV
jgi:hypothetical protein